MVFTEESQAVQSYLLLIDKNLKTLADVPPLFNLKEVVAEVLKRKEEEKALQEAALEETEET